MEQLVLTAQVVHQGEGYVARLEALELEGSGESILQAQDELVDNLRGWIEMHEVGETLEQALHDAGFIGVDENTAIQLEFGVPGVDQQQIDGPI